MPRFAANLSMMFNEHPFLERFEAAKKAGFAAVEFLFPYAFAPGEIAQRLTALGLKLALFNAPPGHWEQGERGLAGLKGREAEFERGFEQALDYAEKLNCPTIHVMAGLVPEAEREAAFARYVAALARAAPLAASAGRTLVLEPINTRDMPGYLINRTSDATRAIGAVGAANLKLQLDFYHRQIMEGDLMRAIQDHHAVIGHVQIAGPPDRHEPDTGEIRFEPIYQALDAIGYSGFIGCEYRPRHTTEAGLGWFVPYREK